MFSSEQLCFTLSCFNFICVEIKRMFLSMKFYDLYCIISVNSVNIVITHCAHNFKIVLIKKEMQTVNSEINLQIFRNVIMKSINSYYFSIT